MTSNSMFSDANRFHSAKLGYRKHKSFAAMANTQQNRQMNEIYAQNYLDECRIIITNHNWAKRIGAMNA